MRNIVTLKGQAGMGGARVANNKKVYQIVVSVPHDLGARERGGSIVSGMGGISRIAEHCPRSKSDVVVSAKNWST